MKRKILAIWSVTFVVLTLFSMVCMPVNAIHTVNNDGSFSYGTTCWDLEKWNSDPSDTYSISGGIATDYRYDYATPKEWGNREQGQAYDLWCLDPEDEPRGSAWSDGVIALTDSSQSLSWRAKYGSAAVYGWGGSDVYIDMWIMFSGPVGNDDLQYAEIIIYLKSYGIVNTGCWTTDDGAGTEWYVYGTHASQIGTSYTTGSINYNYLINSMCAGHGISYGEKCTGATIGMNVGVEAYDGKMKGYFDYVFYKSS